MGRARAVACEHGQVVTVTVIPQDGGATVALRRPAGPGMLLTVTRREAEAINIALTSSLE
jgi:hypothetical protein